MMGPYHFYFALFIIATIKTATESLSDFTYTLDKGYPFGNDTFGSIAGVDIDSNNNIIIFHRGSHRWDGSTFGYNDVYLLRRDSPIKQKTVVLIDPIEKSIIAMWGENLFFMPHGLSLDRRGDNVWLTDVALHQVFKFPVNGSKEPLVIIGTAFEPGDDEKHFCKPTSVADTGDIVFVADGYCNSRIVAFSSQGKYIGEFGQSAEVPYGLNRGVSNQPTFNIPHKIIYAEEKKMLCVADRENGRIQCFPFDPKQNDPNDSSLSLIRNPTPKYTIADPEFNKRVFSLDYSPIQGGILVVISGQSLEDTSKMPVGFVYNATNAEFISRFEPPPGQSFGMAHDLAVTIGDAGSIYVGDIAPVNIWRFSRRVPSKRESETETLADIAGRLAELKARAVSLMHEKEGNTRIVWYIFLLAIICASVLLMTKARRKVARERPLNSIGPIYSNSLPTSINSLFGGHRFIRKARARSSNPLATVFSGRAFLNLFNRTNQRDDFSQIPLEDSDNFDDDKSDSDVEEFNINQTSSSIKINV